MHYEAMTMEKEMVLSVTMKKTRNDAGDVIDHSAKVFLIQLATQLTIHFQLLHRQMENLHIWVKALQLLCKSG